MDVGDGRCGPCGACKLLRRKCVKGCIFAPYFESSGEGTANFAALHKVFGASNATKLLTRLPPHNRLHAVLTLCYEALARSTDPVYGCVSHIFALQQQVVKLEAELAYVHARLSTLHRLYDAQFPETQSSSTPISVHSTWDHHLASSMHFDHPTSLELSTFLNASSPTTPSFGPRFCV